MDPTHTPGTAPETFTSLPDLFAIDPPAVHDDAFTEPCRIIDEYLAEYALQPHIDSIVAAVFTSNGVVYHGGFGRLKANARPVPGKRGPPKEVDIDTIYRLGSMSMLFTVMESMLLKKKGLLSWDDPVEKFLPDFNCQTRAWTHRLDFDDEYEEEDPSHNHPITLRTLTCHMSGLGTLYPTKIVNNWPTNQRGTQDFTNREDIMDCIKITPLVTTPYSFPIYSSVGITLLGWCNVATEEIAFTRDPTHLKVENHALQLERDIFDPLGMYDSYFDVPERKIDRLAVASFSAPEATIDFTDAYNPIAGQYGSAHDLVKFFQFILNPKQPGSLLKAYEVREWLRPVHTWEDGLKEVGAPWEIVKIQDSYGRRRRWYGKSMFE
ncbi:hypothetical protein FRC03_009800 [Tulasnella sp. 419]|nr:hypothetical protein FRC03_009800 [Tulasnella sp. 419]